MKESRTALPLCEVIVHGDYSSKKCGRKVKAEGLCGIHLAARKRREANDAKFREKQRVAADLQAEAKILGEALGIAVRADYNSFGGGYTGDFVVPGDWLRQQVQS